MKVEWSVFIDGECEESELPEFKAGTTINLKIRKDTNCILYVKKKCPACGEVQWIKRGFNVCNKCIP